MLAKLKALAINEERAVSCKNIYVSEMSSREGIIVELLKMPYKCVIEYGMRYVTLFLTNLLRMHQGCF